ncbi:MAG: hypothetical protein ACRDIV_15970 [Ktedonobacteraceae bacterium]
MMNNVEPNFQSQLDTVFAQLNPIEIEEFYAAYQQWSLQQRINELRQRIDAVHEQQADNRQRIHETQPSAIALAALARLQSNGVSDIELLDAMLERGESWLDQTMQRLDYFEQFEDFVSDDYTQWCQGALDGAFDWIDSLREGTEQEAPLETSPEEELLNNEDAGDVEALLLQRLATDDEQDDLAWQEAITLKRTAIQPPSEEATTSAPVEQKPPAPEKVVLQEVETQAEVTEYVPPDEPVPGDVDETPIETAPADSTGTEEQIIPEEALPVEDTTLPESELEQPALVEFASGKESVTDEDALYAVDEQPTLVEFASVEEPTTSEEELLVNNEQPALIESAPAGETSTDEIDEQPTLVEFASIEELSPPEETAEQVTLPEITIPEDIPAPEETAQSETNEPDAIEKSTPEEVDRQEQQALATGEPTTPVRNLPPKRGLLRSLLWILTGK